MNAQPAHLRHDADDLLEHAAWVRRLARDLVNDAATADDIVQETWLAFLRHRPDVSHPLRPWLARVVRNQAAQWRRKGAARRARDRDSAHAESMPSTAEIVERAEAQRAVVTGVLALEEPYRSTLILRYCEGLRPIDIARMRDIPQATVRTHLNRGREQLRAILDEAHGGNRNAWGALLIPLIKPSAPRGLGLRGYAVAGGCAAAVVVAGALIRGPQAPSLNAGAGIGANDADLPLDAGARDGRDLGALPPVAIGRGPEPGPEVTSTDLVATVQLIDAGTGAPLPDFVIGSGGQAARSDAMGRVSLPAADELLAIDDKRNGISTVGSHGTRTRGPLPTQIVERDAHDPTLVRVATGPTIPLDLSPAGVVESAEFEVLLRPQSSLNYTDDGAAIHIAPLRHGPEGDPPLDVQGKATWARFGPPAASLLDDPQAWQVTVRDRSGLHLGETLVDREGWAAGDLTTVRLSQRAALRGSLVTDHPIAACVIALQSKADPRDAAPPRVHAVCSPDAAGEFALKWVRPGPYELVVHSPSHETWSRPVALIAGEASWLDVELVGRARGGALAGTVTSSSGAPIEDTLLLLVGEDSDVIDVQPASWRRVHEGHFEASFHFDEAPGGPLHLEVVALDSGIQSVVEPHPLTAPSATVRVLMLDTVPSSAVSLDLNLGARPLDKPATIDLVLRIDGGLRRHFRGEQSGGTWTWTTFLGGMKWNTFEGATPLRGLALDARFSWRLTSEGHSPAAGTEDDVEVAADGTRVIRVELRPD